MDNQSQRGRVKMEWCRATTAVNSSRYSTCYLFLLLFLLTAGLCASTPGDYDVEMSQLPLSFDYHNYTMMTGFLKEVARKYPKLTSLDSIGKSIQKRELWTLMVSSHQDDSTLPLGTPNIKFIGNIHGNEAVGRELILHMIEYLVTNYEVNSTVTQLLDTTRIYFLPSMNPDGFEISIGLTCSGGKGRKNMKNIDLNRNFPDYFIENKSPIQPETEAIIRWMKRVPFILSASLHGGALVANYPFENHPEDVPTGTFTPSLTPDDDVFKHLATVYARAHPKMHQRGQCESFLSSNPTFEDGITNGASWYSITGGMQDYNYVWHGCMEITLEISCCKYPSHNELNKLWNENREALLLYAQETHKGVKGVVRDSRFGGPIEGARLKITGRDMGFNSSSKGEFWRLLLPRRESYRIEVEADGYERQVIPFQVSTSQGGVTWLEISMKRRQQFGEPQSRTNTIQETKETIHVEDSHTTDATQASNGENTTQMYKNPINESFPLNNTHLIPSELDDKNLTDMQITRTQKSIQHAMVSAGRKHSVMTPVGLSAILFLVRVC